MAGILGNDKTLSDKANEIAAAINGEAPQKGNAQAGKQVMAILLHDFKLRGLDPKLGVTGLLKQVQQGSIKIIQKNNTIMAVQKLNPIAAKVHFFTLDPEPQFQQIVKGFVDTLRQNGCKIVYDVVADPHNVRALQAAGAQISQPDAPNMKLKALL
jgi:hypothetical protein